MKIFKQMAVIMSECPAIGKDSFNQQQGFKYRGIDAIYNALQPLFAKHGVFSVPEVLEERMNSFTTKKGTVMNHVIARIKYTFYAEDGSNFSSIVIGEAMDMGDKASNKAMAVAHKYAITQALKIPFQSDDPDASSPMHGQNESSDGVYRVDFGKKYPDMTIAEIGLDDAYSYAMYFHNMSTMPDAKPMGDKVKKFLEEVKKAKANANKK